MKWTILTCSPHFHDSALHEIRRHHADVKLLQELSPGYLLLESSISFDQLTAPWRHRLPIYLHHLFPVQHIHTINDHQPKLDEVIQVVRAFAPSNSIIQARTLPYVTGTWEPELRAAFPQAERVQGRVTSVVISPEKLYMGVSWATQNCSPWPGGRIPITEPVCNRAGYKLLEAVKVLGLRLNRGEHALDLGAAPGAWTTILRQRGLRVTAVAPDSLYPWLAQDSDVQHHAMLAEEYLQHCREQFDLVVNDMRLDARDSARLMVACADHLAPNAPALMTLKLHDSQRLRVMDHAYRLLRPAYKIMQIRQLVHNKREVTLLLRRK
jgi:23S rRNA (cytidine2498-2'-O)-methyltransferase